MPLFEYECKSCDHSFEALVFGTENVDCPECGGNKLKKLMSVPMAKISDSSPSACGDPSLPPCGASGCRRTGRA